MNNLIDSLRAYHEKEPCWGNLHIVMDDGNLEPEHIQWCYDYAIKNGDQHGARLALELLKLSPEALGELYDRHI